uniref:Pyrin n=1 Tax=Propithecus coquereli TaxID=379532 RepID=A0A2K6FJA3_PROCO
MVGTLSDHLLSTLEELVPYDLEKFKFKLQTTSLEKEHSRIPWGQLQTARPVKVARLLVAYYGEEYAVRLTLQVLRAINQRLVAEELHRLTGQGKRTPGKASSPLCHAQEGDPVGGCVQDSCSCPGASGESKASGSHSPRCTRCQARKNSGSLSPQPLPQCKRHMQVQLLFCEDHGEPICLICRLSQEHRGHQVRLIEEVALEYKEQIQKQLEHLQELRKHGEEQRSQGDKKTAYFLKQIEIQKQRARSQVEQLCKFLEQQEKVFVAWLEELGQTIGQVREAYGTRVSQDIALLDSLIGELEAKQRQSEWELLQSLVSRAKTVPIPELWATPPEMKEKMHLFYKKSEFVEKSLVPDLLTMESPGQTWGPGRNRAVPKHRMGILVFSCCGDSSCW